MVVLVAGQGRLVCLSSRLPATSTSPPGLICPLPACLPALPALPFFLRVWCSVKAMEVDEKPTEDYGDIGGLDKQIQELREAIVLPITHRDRFVKLGIKPPKGVLLHGPPGGWVGAGWVGGWVGGWLQGGNDWGV